MSHPLAYIHPEAQIHPSAVIEPFAYIEKDVVIGEGSWIGPHACIHNGARIGKNVRIFPGAAVSALPQDLKFDGEVTTAEIGDNTVIREYVTVSRGTKDKYTTRIGSNCLVMAYVHVAHDCIIGNHCILVNNVQVAGHVQIDDWAIIGGSSAIHQFVKVGTHVMIAGGSLVRKDVPPFVKAAREPLSFAGINSIGLRRRGFQNEQISDIQEIYRIIYQRGLSYNKALDVAELELKPSAERDEIINFIRKSERGIMKGFDSDMKDFSL